jgi:hypothetical protein
MSLHYLTFLVEVNGTILRRWRGELLSHEKRDRRDENDYTGGGSYGGEVDEEYDEGSSQ